MGLDLSSGVPPSQEEARRRELEGSGCGRDTCRAGGHQLMGGGWGLGSGCGCPNMMGGCRREGKRLRRTAWGPPSGTPCRAAPAQPVGAAMAAVAAPEEGTGPCYYPTRGLSSKAPPKQLPRQPRHPPSPKQKTRSPCPAQVFVPGLTCAPSRKLRRGPSGTSAPPATAACWRAAAAAAVSAANSSASAAARCGPTSWSMMLPASLGALDAAARQHSDSSSSSSVGVSSPGAAGSAYAACRGEGEPNVRAGAQGPKPDSLDLSHLQPDWVPGELHPQTSVRTHPPTHPPTHDPEKRAGARSARGCEQSSRCLRTSRHSHLGCACSARPWPDTAAAAPPPRGRAGRTAACTAPRWRTSAARTWRRCAPAFRRVSAAPRARPTGRLRGTEGDGDHGRGLMQSPARSREGR
jgi:hypothetical protein